jgi:hypothetical protein
MSEMHEESRIFSDAWHRVAAVRVALRTSVRAHRQIFHGEQWVVLRDSLSNDWYRVSADAYAFLSRLSLSSTVDEIWAAARLGQAPLHDGQWSMATMEVCLALLQSSTLGQDIILRAQTPTPLT